MQSAYLKPLFNNRGFSLISALTTAAVVGIFSIIMIQILGQISTAISTRTNELDQQAEIDANLFKVQKIAGSGLYLKGTTASLDLATLLPTSPGQVITNFDSTTFPLDGSVRTVGLFFRETAKIGNSGARISNIQPTGIYFMQPNAATKAPGFLFIDPGSSANLKARGGDFFFSSIVSFQTSDPQNLPTPGVTLLRSVLLQITIRKYLTGTPDTWVFCPQAQMGTGTCVTSSTYVDTVKSFRINFRNNYDPNNPSFSMFGRVYFFN